MSPRLLECDHARGGRASANRAGGRLAGRRWTHRSATGAVRRIGACWRGRRRARTCPGRTSPVGRGRGVASACRGASRAVPAPSPFQGGRIRHARQHPPPGTEPHRWPCSRSPAGSDRGHRGHARPRRLAILSMSGRSRILRSGHAVIPIGQVAAVVPGLDDAYRAFPTERAQACGAEPQMPSV